MLCYSISEPNRSCMQSLSRKNLLQTVLEYRFRICRLSSWRNEQRNRTVKLRRKRLCMSLKCSILFELKPCANFSNPRTLQSVYRYSARSVLLPRNCLPLYAVELLSWQNPEGSNLCRGIPMLCRR